MNAEQICVKIVLMFIFVFHNKCKSSLCFDQRYGFREVYNPEAPETDMNLPRFDSHVYNSELPKVLDSYMPSTELDSRLQHISESPKFPDFNSVPSDSGGQYNPGSPRVPEFNRPPAEFDFDIQEFPRFPRPDMPPAPTFGSHIHPNYHRPWHDMHDRGPAPPDRPPMKLKYPGVPRNVRVQPLPLHESDHKLQLNVSWAPPVGVQPLDYSLEVISETATEDCTMSICLEYNIPKEAVSMLIPKVIDHISGNCAFNPGCSYLVRLTANPWDGHTVAETRIDLDECTAGVCSCAHAFRLPAPFVTANTVHIKGDKFANVSWTLPTPRYPLRLPKGLAKKSYIVSLGKQMVSDAHPAPWFYNIMETVVEAYGAVSEGDTKRWRLLPLNKSGGERSDERSGERAKRQTLDVKLLARVNLIDERGCIGPAGNATAYDPDEIVESSLMIYALWAVSGGVCVFIMMLMLIMGARAVKKALIALRPAPADVLEPLRSRSAWLPLHLRPLNYLSNIQLNLDRQQPVWCSKVVGRSSVTTTANSIIRPALRYHVNALSQKLHRSNKFQLNRMSESDSM